MSVHFNNPFFRKRRSNGVIDVSSLRMLIRQPAFSRAITADSQGLIDYQRPPYSDGEVMDRLFRSKPRIAYEEDEVDDDGIPENDSSIFEEEDGEVDPTIRLGRHLLKFGKVTYKCAELMPPWVDDKKKELTSYRTTAQLRRCLKSWMIKPDRDFLRRYRLRPLGWGHIESKEKKAADIKAYGPEETIAYVQYFFPSRFAITRRILEEIKMLNPNYEPRRVIDFGCGPATSFAAVDTVWGSKVVDKYSGIDMSSSMLDAAKIMTEGSSIDSVFWDKVTDVVSRASLRGERFDLAIVSYTLTELTSDVTRRAATQLLFELLDVGGMVVIIEPGNPFGSHTVRSARKFILETFNEEYIKLRSSGLLKRKDTSHKTESRSRGSQGLRSSSADSTVSPSLQIEVPSTPTVTMVLPAPDPFTYLDFTANVVAPCTHDKPCPLGSGYWCSFSQRVFSPAMRKYAMDKFSYVVIQKRLVDKALRSKKAEDLWSYSPEIKANVSSLWFVKPPKDDRSLPNPNPTPLNVLRRMVDPDLDEDDQKELCDKLIEEIDWEEYTPPLHREEWGRVLRSPIKGRGHVTIDMCTSSGMAIRSIVSKSGLNHIPSLFTAVRKTSWGGLTPVILEEPTMSALTRNAKVMKLQNQSRLDDFGNEVISEYDEDLTEQEEGDNDEEEEEFEYNADDYDDPSELFGIETDTLNENGARNMQGTSSRAQRAVASEKNKYYTVTESQDRDRGRPLGGRPSEQNSRSVRSKMNTPIDATSGPMDKRPERRQRGEKEVHGLKSRVRDNSRDDEDDSVFHRHVGVVPKGVLAGNSSGLHKETCFIENGKPVMKKKGQVTFKGAMNVFQEESVGESKNSASDSGKKKGRDRRTPIRRVR